MKPSGVGGQAVIEGVMMKNKEKYAIAVRKPNKEIVVEKNTYISISEKHKILKLPIFRGVLAFIESMVIGTKTLTFSASFYEEEEEVKPTKMEKAFSKVFKEKAEAVAMGLTLLLSMALAIGIFMITPFFVANLLANQIESNIVLTLIEGCIRIFIFVAYVGAISQIKDIKRMFMYHGAEHKTINCLEQGFELTVDNVKWQSRLHKRCGTSFMFLVMFVSVLFFIFIRVDTIWLRVLTRLLLVPLIAGVSYEFIRLAGKSNSKIVHVLSMPGMWLQGLTTKEPDEDMIEVAIQSVEAVFDWREFLGQNDKTKKSKKSGKNNKHNNKNERKQNRKNSINQEEIQIEKKDNTIDEGKSSEVEKVDSKSKQEMDSKKKNISSGKDYNRSTQETAITKEKTLEATPEDIFGEEDDEILRALDRYLSDKKESSDKE
jgi:uncharacterized protein YqhQ